MEIRVLRYFLTVVREESITRAAEVLHITQPTLSRQLAQMEEQMGVKLFVRRTRKITLTNEGVLLRRRAEEILELVDKTAKEYITPEDLVGVPLIMPRRLSVQGEIANWFGEYYDQLQILFTSNLPANSAVMVNQQLAYSLNICGSIDYWDKSKITSRPLKPELNAGCVLAWKRTAAIWDCSREIHRSH